MKQTLNEQIDRIKAMMNINEDEQQMDILQKDTEEFNVKTEEELMPEEFKEVMCTDIDSIELPSEINNEQKQKIAEIKEKMKTASFSELMQLKKQIRELKRQQQNEQVAETALISFLGVSMPPAFAIAIGAIIFVMVLSCLGRLLKFTRTTTYFCDGTRSRGLFGLLRW